MFGEQRLFGSLGVRDYSVGAADVVPFKVKDDQQAVAACSRFDFVGSLSAHCESPGVFTKCEGVTWRTRRLLPALFWVSHSIRCRYCSAMSDVSSLGRVAGDADHTGL